MYYLVLILIIISMNMQAMEQKQTPENKEVIAVSQYINHLKEQMATDDEGAKELISTMDDLHRIQATMSVGRRKKWNNCIRTYMDILVMHPDHASSFSDMLASSLANDKQRVRSDEEQLIDKQMEQGLGEHVSRLFFNDPEMKKQFEQKLIKILKDASNRAKAQTITKQ